MTGGRRLACVLAAWCAWSAPVLAQDDAATLGQRIEALDTTKPSPAQCDAQLTGAAAGDAPALLYGGRLCSLAAMPVEGSFLLLAGQLRATVDILLLPPATQADDRRLRPLYTMLYYGGGLNGVNDDVLHDPAQRARFLELVDGWQPAYTPAYQPGWTPRKRPEGAAYAAAIARAKAELRQELSRLVRLDSDDRYYALQRAYNAILARVPREGGLSQDSVDGRRFTELQQLMRARGLAIGVDMGPPPPDPSTLAGAGGRAASAADDPPASPGPSEAPATAASGATVASCTDQAERMAVQAGGKVARTLVTTGSRWGTVLRADVTGSDQGAVRFTCSDAFTGEQPFSLGTLQPLSGPGVVSAP